VWRYEELTDWSLKNAANTVEMVRTRSFQLQNAANSTKMLPYAGPTLPCPIMLGTTAVTEMTGTRSGFRNQGFGTGSFWACGKSAIFMENATCFIV
jgi:hypothetical protein